MDKQIKDNSIDEIIKKEWIGLEELVKVMNGLENPFYHVVHLMLYRNVAFDYRYNTGEEVRVGYGWVAERELFRRRYLFSYNVEMRY